MDNHASPHNVKTRSVSDKEKNRAIEQEILQVIRDIRYGSVEIIIHDSQVVQIERREKRRFDKGVFHLSVYQIVGVPIAYRN